MDTDRKGFITTADIETIKRVMEFRTLYGSDMVVVTAENYHRFDVALLAARVIAATTRGKFLAINANNDLILLDSLPQPQNPPDVINGMSIGYNRWPELEEAECRARCTEDAPRNRGERRHGRRDERPIWEKDWRSK